MEYYDLILTGMSLSVIAGLSLGFLTSIPLNVTAGGGALIAAAFMYHGMFQNAPIPVRESSL